MTRYLRGVLLAAVLVLAAGLHAADLHAEGLHPDSESEFEKKLVWQQANEPARYREFRPRFLAAFAAPDQAALKDLIAPTYDRPERLLEFLAGLASDNGKLEVLRFRYLDRKKQRLDPQLLAVYHAEFEKGSWWEIRIGLDDAGRLSRFIITDTNYNEDLPLVRNRTPLHLPFTEGEEWYVLWGGITEESNYHVSSRAQKNALDLLIVHPDSLQTFATDGRTNDDYYAFGKDVLAPCDGIVEKVIADVPDNVPGVMNPSQLTGNTLVIRSPEDEFALLAHLQAGSIQVSEGDEVEAGQFVGRCGNSGNSSEPHLHLQLMDRPDLDGSTGIEMRFTTMLLDGSSVIADYAPIRGNRIARPVNVARTPNGQPSVRVGLDRIANGEASLPADARLGLIVHPASVASDGRHAIEILQQAGANLVRLFGPEHGLRGEAAAGERVADGRDPISGLPVVSLYGASRKPAAADLGDLDALVFDLQGAGVRFYTYVSTMILALEAAAESDIDFVVLDRPNPLGGDRIEGPVSAARDVVGASFVNMAPGPLVHGLTLGEMARYVNSRLDRPARLRVIEMAGWQRSMTWKDTGRHWVPPSPNLRSAEAALAYPGVALLEASNVSEGRGTETPFLLFGAPWLNPAALDPGDLARAVSGVRLEATEFEPVSGPAAPGPKYEGEICRGFRIEVIDGSAFEGYRLGLELVSRLSRQDGFAWRQEGRALTWLLGTPAVFEALSDGRPVAEILAAEAADHELWRSERASALLY